MKQLVEQIKNAFQEVQIPSEDSLLLSDTGGEDLWIESFLGHEYSSWKDLPAESIEYENSALSALTPEAFLSYAPAYMVWVIENHNTSDSMTVNYTIYAFNLSGLAEGELKKKKMQRFEMFTKLQKETTLAFLRYMTSATGADNEAAQSAIDSYWNRYEK